MRDRRESTRFSAGGEVLWRSDHAKGICQLLDLSAGGAQISPPSPPLKVGSKLHITLLVRSSIRIASIPVEVHRVTDEGVILKFLHATHDFRAEIDEIAREVMGSLSSREGADR